MVGYSKEELCGQNVALVRLIRSHNSYFNSMSSAVTTDLSQAVGLCKQAGEGHGQGRTVTLRRGNKTHHLYRLLLTHRLGE